VLNGYGNGMNFAGHLLLRAQSRGAGKTSLGEQSFRAPFHVGKSYADAHALLVQVVNPTAGVLEGDKLESHIAVDSGAALLVTTPSATRVFHMRAGAATSRQVIRVARGAWLEFWPEPLVPHAQADFTQTTEIEVEEGAEMLFADFLIPGRIARGEIWQWRRLVLDLKLRIDRRLILRERAEQTGEELKALSMMAGMAQATFGTLFAASPNLADEEQWKDQLLALHGPDLWLGISRLRGDYPAYSIKLIAPDGDALRRAHRQVRHILSCRLPRLQADPRKL
jgi:urease accessory protein